MDVTVATFRKYALPLVLWALSSLFTAQAAKKDVQVRVKEVANSYSWESYDAAYADLKDKVRNRLNDVCETHPENTNKLGYVSKESVEMTLYEQGHQYQQTVNGNQRYRLKAKIATGTCSFSVNKAKNTSESAQNIKTQLRHTLENKYWQGTSDTNDSAMVFVPEIEIKHLFSLSAVFKQDLAQSIINRLYQQCETEHPKVRNNRINPSTVRFDRFDYQQDASTKRETIRVSGIRASCHFTRNKQDEEQQDKEQSSIWDGESTQDTSTAFSMFDGDTTSSGSSANSGYSAFDGGGNSNAGTSGDSAFDGDGNSSSAFSGKTTAHNYKVVTKDNRTGVVAANGQVIFPFKEWEFVKVNPNTAVVKYQESSKVIKLASDCNGFDTVEYVYTEGIIDRSGNWITAPTTTKIEKSELTIVACDLSLSIE